MEDGRFGFGIDNPRYPNSQLVSKMLSVLAEGDRTLAAFTAQPLARMKPLSKDILAALLARLKRADGDPDNWVVKDEIIAALLS